MATSDDELVRRWQGGDSGAFAELVRLHRRGVYRVAYAVLGSADDAEDVVQDAFVRAWQARAQCDPRRGFAAWVRRITVNCAISRLRNGRRGSHVPGDLPATVPGPHRQAVAAELRARVSREIEALPLKQRLAITLFHLDELDLSETAQALGCSVGAVKSHLHRARTKLATALADELDEE